MPTYTTSAGGTLHYQIQGEGEMSMLLLHGLTQSQVTFKALLPALESGRMLILCDLPGHGESYHPEHYQAGAMVADVTELLREVIRRPAIVYGHSLGSLVATGLAAEAPELVSRLILSDPPLIVWDETRWHGSIISSYFGWARKTLRGGYTPEQILPMLQVAFPQRETGVLQDQVQALCQLDVRIIDALFEAELATLNEVLDSFERVQCPTLLMQADPKILAAASDADIKAIQSRLAHGEHVKFAGADHDLHLWKPRRILETVEQFLQQ